MNKIYADVTEDENVDEPNFQWVVLASEVEEREAALTDYLDAALKQVKENWDYAQDKQQRLTIAFKSVADAKSPPPCPNCKVCMGSPDFPENCLINGVKP